MKTFVCNFAPVRFLPYRETGEFVNVGVVVHCPQIDFFAFRLKARKTRRVTDFFPELEVNLLKKAIAGLRHELDTLPMTRTDLERLRDIDQTKAGQLVDRFRELVRDREGILHFGPMGTTLVEDPRKAADNLFAHYVERQFAQAPEYKEKVMKNRLDQFLKKWNLSRFYKKNALIGDDDFHVTMPFAHFSGKAVERAIKPINLSQETPSEITDHGGTWIGRMNRLKKKGQLPPLVIFPVMYPNSEKRLVAAEEICSEMADLGIVILPFSNNEKDSGALHKAADIRRDED